MSELVDVLMDGERLAADIAGTREIAARYASQTYAEWLGVKTFNRLNPAQEYTVKTDRALCALVEALRMLDGQLRKLDDVLHRSLSETDPDGAADTDLAAFARKAAAR